MIHKVRQGECLSSIAQRYGFASWRDLYEHPQNADLRKARKNPNILYPGDEVFIPERTCSFTGATGGSHKFVVKRERPILRLCVQRFDGTPLDGARYQLKIDGREESGTVGSGGVIELPIPMAATQASLTVTEGQGDSEHVFDFDLRIGHMDPITELSGVKARLTNLGFDLEPVGGDGADGDQLKRALIAFQSANDLDPSGELDDATRAKLEERHDGTA